MKLVFSSILIVIIMLATLWISTNQYYLYKIKKHKSNGQDVVSIIKQKYGTESSGINLRWHARHDMWFFNSIVTCEVENNKKISAVLQWESEGFEIRAATNRTREITPELGPPCDTSSLAYDERFSPFFICTK